MPVITVIRRWRLRSRPPSCGPLAASAKSLDQTRPGAVAPAGKVDGYVVEIADLQVKSKKLALQRTAVRAREGGHNVPLDDVLPHSVRGWHNFRRINALWRMKGRYTTIRVDYRRL